MRLPRLRLGQFNVNNMTNKKCFKCDEDIKETIDTFMLGLDKPYCNIPFHKQCIRLMGGYDNAVLYVTENEKKLYNILHNTHKGSKGEK